MGASSSMFSDVPNPRKSIAIAKSTTRGEIVSLTSRIMPNIGFCRQLLITNNRQAQIGMMQMRSLWTDTMNIQIYCKKA
jgi:hypothetical protein